MRNILITIRYHGAYYHGFQVQKNAITITQVFQDAVEKVFGSRLAIKGCSRTDTGVHANKYCISMQTQSAIPNQSIITALNHNLPDTISVVSCEDVAADFHARYHCKYKEYVYKILNSDKKDPFLKDLVLQHRYKMNDIALEQACQYLIGTHDFSAFCDVGNPMENHVRTIVSARIERSGEMLCFYIKGDGFLYHMVRIIVGTLLKVASNKIPPQEIQTIIQSKNRKLAGLTVPPQGLYLNEVFY